MANYIVNKILFKNYTFDLINKYSDEIEINDMLSEYDININDLKNTKKKINDILKSNKIRIIPGKYLFALSFITEKYGERSGFQKNKIRASITEHYKQIFLENLITLIISLPFFLISIIFTLGYRSELLILSILLAFIFLLFIKSALITPIFYLITLKKLSLVFKD